MNNELTILDFTKQIEKQTGKTLTGLDDAHKRVLNIVYRYNYYNHQSIKPNVITPELYFQLHGKEIEPRVYESLGRRVRKICSDLLKAGILSKKEDKSYEIEKGSA